MPNIVDSYLNLRKAHHCPRCGSTDITIDEFRPDDEDDGHRMIRATCNVCRNKAEINIVFHDEVPAEIG